MNSLNQELNVIQDCRQLVDLWQDWRFHVREAGRCKSEINQICRAHGVNIRKNISGMRFRRMLVFAFLAFASSVVSSAAPPPSPSEIQVEWLVPTNAPAWATNYVIWIGGQGAVGINYYTNWVVSGTNANIPISSLISKTNYVIVQANTQLSVTNAFITSPSNPIQIVPGTPTPVLKLSSMLLFKNDITQPWQEYQPLPDIFVAITNEQQFFALKSIITK
jgi:hypothetical protein